MTQPEDSTGDAPSRTESAASAEGAAPKPDTATAKPKPAKKPAAKPGTLKMKEAGPGDGAGAAANGGAIVPADSTLLGKSTVERPAATPKPEDQRPVDPVKLQKEADAEAAKAVEGPRVSSKTAIGKTVEPVPAGEVAMKTEAAAETAKDAAKPAEVAAKTTSKDVPKDSVAKDAMPKATPGKDVASKAAAKDGAAVPAPLQKVTVQKTGFWPVVLGGVVAAALGSVATIWALPHLPAGWLPDQGQTVMAAPDVDLEAIRADAVSAAEARVAGLVEARVADLRETLVAAVPGEPGDAQAAFDSSALDQQIAALRGRLDQQAQQLDDLTARPAIDPGLAGRMQELAAQAEALQQQIHTAAQQAQSRITEVQVEAEKLQAAAADSTRRAEAVAAIASLQSALDRGVTPEEARATLEGAGMDAPEALTREVPSLTSLQEDFGPAARAALRATLREDSASGEGNLLTNFLRAQTGARSVAPREGVDPDAVLSRAGGAVEAGRISAALDEMQALPDTAKAAPDMAAWLAGAESYRAAQAALDDLSANSN